MALKSRTSNGKNLKLMSLAVISPFAPPPTTGSEKLMMSVTVVTSPRKGFCKAAVTRNGAEVSSNLEVFVRFVVLTRSAEGAKTGGGGRNGSTGVGGGGDGAGGGGDGAGGGGDGGGSTGGVAGGGGDGGTNGGSKRTRAVTCGWWSKSLSAADAPPTPNGACARHSAYSVSAPDSLTVTDKSDASTPPCPCDA